MLLTDTMDTKLYKNMVCIFAVTFSIINTSVTFAVCIECQLASYSLYEEIFLWREILIHAMSSAETTAQHSRGSK